MRDLFHSLTTDPRMIGLRKEVLLQGAETETLNRDLRHLQTELGRTRLALEALCEVLAIRLGIERNEIIDKMLEIDLRDGQQDNRLTPVPVPCGSCGRMLAAKSQSCLYCGEPRPEQSGVTGPV